MSLCLMTGILLLLLIFLSKDEKIPKEWEKKGYIGLQQHCAFYLYRMGCSLYTKHRGIKEFQRNFSRCRIREDLRATHPEINQEVLHCKYYVDKIIICLIVTHTGIIIMIFMCIQGVLSPGVLKDGGIMRNSWGRGSRLVTLIAKPDITITGNQGAIQDEELQIEIGERRYSNKELDILYTKLCKEGAWPFLGMNKNPEYITENLVLADTLRDYPFYLRWSSSQYRFLDNSGVLGGEIPEGGAEVRLIAELTYFDWKREYGFNVRVYPDKIRNEIGWKERIEIELEKCQNKTEDKDKVVLPDEVEGIKIKWEEKKEDKSAAVLLITILGMIAVYIGKDRDLRKMAEKRNREMLLYYPEIVQKLTLLIGAGLTVRSAWIKMSDEYERAKEAGRGKRYVYEEMVLARREMESGVSEIACYDNFAKRCRLPCYLKFGTLLTQNLKKGSAGLQQMLQNEARTAFEERKNLARRQGEEADTKLLIPMMMMMGMVMLIVMIPAFLSFSV